MLYKSLAANMKSSHGWGNDFGPWVKIAEDIRSGSWEIIRGFTEDHWNTLPEV